MNRDNCWCILIVIVSVILTAVVVGCLVNGCWERTDYSMYHPPYNQYRAPEPPTALGLALAGRVFEPAQQYEATFKERHRPCEDYSANCIVCHIPKKHECDLSVDCGTCHCYNDQTWEVEEGCTGGRCVACHSGLKF